MPLVQIKEIAPQTFIGIWKIEETVIDLENQLQLKPHELAVLKSLQGEKRNLHWLATRVLLRKMMNTNEYIDCKADENGKPYLVNFPHQISLSHSYDYAAVMISEKHRVGIDIEIIKTKIERVQQKFLKPNELSFINSTHNIEHLYACWCVKEALYKLNGKKEYSLKDNFNIQAFPYNNYGNVNASICKQNFTRHYNSYYCKFENYMLAYVYES